MVVFLRTFSRWVVVSSNHCLLPIADTHTHTYTYRRNKHNKKKKQEGERSLSYGCHTLIIVSLSFSTSSRQIRDVAVVCVTLLGVFCESGITRHLYSENNHIMCRHLCICTLFALHHVVEETQITHTHTQPSEPESVRTEGDGKLQQAREERREQ